MFFNTEYHIDYCKCSDVAGTVTIMISVGFLQVFVPLPHLTFAKFYGRICVLRGFFVWFFKYFRSCLFFGLCLLLALSIVACYVPILRLCPEVDYKKRKLCPSQSYEDVIFSWQYNGKSDTFASYCSQWDKVPSTVRDSLKDEGWEIIVCADTLDDEGNIMGMASLFERRIYLDGHNCRIDSLHDNTLLHEVGHFVHYSSFDNLLGIAKIWRIMKEEGSSLVSLDEYVLSCKYLSGDPLDTYETYDDWRDYYCMSTPFEYFAEAFMLYVVSPSELRRLCPNTYAIVSSEVAALDLLD